MSVPATAPPRRSPFRPSLDWLLAFVPIAIALRVVPAWHNDTALFIVSCLAIVPLAGWMGRATEHLAEQVGEGAGGLLNATFGNAAELIIGLMALQKGLYAVVKASITGSIIGNLLLVLGLSFVSGGIKFREQAFNPTAASAATTSLSLAAIALIVPTVFHQVAESHGGWTPAQNHRLSFAIAVVLFATYLFTLLFSLGTHKRLFTGETPGEAAEEDDYPIEADEHHEQWSRGKSIAILVVATLFVAVISEFLVGAVENARHALGLTEVFVGVVVVAIIGNAAEHSSAILMAMRNKMGLSLSIAIGSTLQIALFVAPILVFASYCFGKPMSLEFSVPEIVAVVAAAFIVGQVCADGKSNWLEGVQLISVYLILGILFFCLPELPPDALAIDRLHAQPPLSPAHP